MLIRHFQLFGTVRLGWAQHPRGEIISAFVVHRPVKVFQ